MYRGSKSLAHRARAIPISCPEESLPLRSVLTFLSHHLENQLHLPHQTLSEGSWSLVVVVQTETSFDIVPLGCLLRRDEVDMDHAEPNTRSAIATI